MVVFCLFIKFCRVGRRREGVGLERRGKKEKGEERSGFYKIETQKILFEVPVFLSIPHLRL